MAELEEDIRFLRQQTQRIGQSDPDRPFWLNILGISLHDRYEILGASADLEDAILVWQQATDLTDEQNQADRALRLNNLGLGLADRYKLTGKLEDLEESIRVTKEAVAVTPSNDLPGRIKRLSSLGSGLNLRYEQIGDMEDLEEAIQILQEVANSTPPTEHINRALRLSNLGTALGNRYKRTGSLTDLGEAVRVSQEAVDITHPYSCPDRAIWLSNLGLKLGERYQRAGSISDLETAIQVLRSAVDMTPDRHPDRPIWLNNLGAKLINRYEQAGAFADLEEAIQVAQTVVDLTPNDHRDKAIWLNNLATRLNARYKRNGILSDLEEAIQIHRKSADLRLQGHGELARGLNNLGLSVISRYNRTGNSDNLEEGIQCLQQAVDLNSNHYPVRVAALNSLGHALHDRYLQTRKPADLEESIEVARKVIEATPHDHPERASRLNTLAFGISCRYEWTGDMADLTDAVSLYEVAVHCSNSPVVFRIMSARAMLIIHIASSSWNDAYVAARMAMGFVPKVTQRSLEASDMHHRLSQISGIACEAASVALEIQTSPIEALNFLESGRGVLATSLDDQRADVSALQESCPDLATRFLHLRRQMESSLTESDPMLDTTSSAHPRDQLARLYEIDRVFDELVEDIRKKPGFDNFLLAPGKQEMCDAAKDGPIVIINLSHYRCDAIIITPTDIRSLALPDLLSEDVDMRAEKKQFGTSGTLKWLWDVVAGPILNTLSITNTPCDNDTEWPRIWWVPTGSLSKFPLHAAGHHSRNSSASVIDRVMSSYSPTVKLIVQGRQRRVKRTISTGKRRSLLVAMEDTPGLSPRLGFVRQELDIVRSLCESLEIESVEPGRYKNEITLHLPTCDMFHFAGHGYVNPSVPSQSYLALNDWVSNPLTVADLLKLNLRASPPFLAYLSACGTGQVMDDWYLDESVHLITACQLAGFQHVIGTLWEVNDKVCVDVARITYETIRDEGMTDASVCLGLHRAIRELRNRWFETSMESRGEVDVIDDTSARPTHKADLATRIYSLSHRKPGTRRGMRDVIPYDDDDDNDYENGNGEIGLWQWVPYVHFGL